MGQAIIPSVRFPLQLSFFVSHIKWHTCLDAIKSWQAELCTWTQAQTTLDFFFFVLGGGGFLSHTYWAISHYLLFTDEAIWGPRALKKKKIMIQSWLKLSQPLDSSPEISFLISLYIFGVFVWENLEFAMQPRLPLISWSSCPYLLSARIISIHFHLWPETIFVVDVYVLVL